MPVKITTTSAHHPLRKRRRHIQVPLGAQRFLAVFEGLEGGFAIGASILVALALAGLEPHLLLTTVIVTVIVNGFNNASLKYSSEHYLDELDGREKRSPFKVYFLPAFIEFISYFAISFVSIVPLLVLDHVATAVWISVAITVTTLFLAGYFRAYMLHAPRLRDACETAGLGSGIILVGCISGYVIMLL